MKTLWYRAGRKKQHKYVWIRVWQRLGAVQLHRYIFKWQNVGLICFTLYTRTQRECLYKCGSCYLFIHQPWTSCLSKDILVWLKCALCSIGYRPWGHCCLSAGLCSGCALPHEGSAAPPRQCSCHANGGRCYRGQSPGSEAQSLASVPPHFVLISLSCQPYLNLSPE